MSRTIARYHVMYGCTGCMPTMHDFVTFTTRRELLAYIREQLTYFHMPQSCLRRETRGIRAIWRFIAKRGSSVAHFSMHHDGMALEFNGLTADEYEDAIAEDC